MPRKSSASLPDKQEAPKKRKNSRAKGQRQERALVKKLSEWWGTEFFRTPGSGAFATRGFVGANVSFAGDIVTKDKEFPFCVESKNEEGWELEQLLTAPKNKIQKWWDQACSECPEGMVPLLVFTRNHKPEFYMMPADVGGYNLDAHVFKLHMQRGPVILGLFDTLMATPPFTWIGVTTQTRLGPDPKDPAKEVAKAEKSFDKMFEE